MVTNDIIHACTDDIVRLFELRKGKDSAEYMLLPSAIRSINNEELALISSLIPTVGYVKCVFYDFI